MVIPKGGEAGWGTHVDSSLRDADGRGLDVV